MAYLRRYSMLGWCILFLLFAFRVMAQSGDGDKIFTRCQLSEIANFTKVHAGYLPYVGDKTDEVERARVCIGPAIADDGSGSKGLFILTNFRDETANPVKALFPGDYSKWPYSLEFLLANTIGEAATKNSRRFASLYRNTIPIVVDESLLFSPDWRQMPIGDVKNLYCRGASGNTRPMIEINTPRGPQRAVSIVKSNQVYYRVLTPRYNEGIDLLNNHSFNISIKLLSVVEDADTKQEVSRLPINSRIEVDPQNITRSELLSTLNAHRQEGIIFVLGHIEGQTLFLGNSGASTAKITVDELQQFAEANGINIAVLGCASGYKAAIGQNLAPKIFSAHMVRKFQEAIKHTDSARSFFYYLSTPDEPLVISSASLSSIGAVGRVQDNAILRTVAFSKDFRLRVSGSHLSRRNQVGTTWPPVSVFRMSVRYTGP